MRATTFSPRAIVTALLLLSCVSRVVPVEAAERQVQGAEFFETNIRPVLVEHCYECHSSRAGVAEGGLQLDTRAGLQKGGQSGAAIVAGKAQESLLLKALRYEDLEMPPEGRLSSAVVADFEKWIEMGAPDPRDEEAETQDPESRGGSPDELWSLQPIEDPRPPTVGHGGWPRSDIDRFILSRLEAEALEPVRDARPAALLRRVYFDLVGLPPPPEEIDRFLSEPSPAAYKEIVDRLLASPHFGERWGRHWLDVARYAESNGKSRDVLMPHAWRYRDYVVDAYNTELPYDRFITEQIAGDLLPPDSPQERDRQRIATGFLAIGSKTLVGATRQMDLIDEQINTMGKAVLGLTTGCARCHDHKFDPIPTRDYYALAGIFLSTDTLFGGGLRGPKDQAGKTKELFVLGPNVDTRIAEVRQHKRKLDQLDKKLKSLSEEQKAARKKLPKNWKTRLERLREEGLIGGQSDAATAEDPEDRRIIAYAALLQEVRNAKQRRKKLKEVDLPELDFAVGAREANKVRDCKLHIRGNRKNLGDPVPRGFLSCMDLPDGPQVKSKQSGRLQLARWLTHDANPLTARVAVNRVWLHLFGRGLVRSVDNFGANGEAPTHPKLLDHLATRFMRNGWSTKQLIREIVLSRTYQLSTEFNEAAYASDPDNRLYWRMRRRRLEAEAIRDAMLAASGQLDRNRPGASPVARIGDGEVGRSLNTKPLREPFRHRSVYLPIIRGIVPKVLKIFDFPEPSNVQGQRVTTTVPAQSLFLMNNPFVIDQAKALAGHVLKSESDQSQRFDLLFKRCFARPPEPEEVQQIRSFLSRSADRSTGQRDAWTTVCHGLLASAEFRFIE